MGQEDKDEVQRWSAKRRTALVVSVLKGETSIAEAGRCGGSRTPRAYGGRRPVPISRRPGSLCGPSGDADC